MESPEGRQFIPGISERHTSVWLSHGVQRAQIGRVGEKWNTLHLHFTVPVIDTNLTIVESDPFFFMVQNANQTCRIRITYHGPKNAMVSHNEDCVHAVGMEPEARGRLYLPNLLKCQGRKNTLQENDWFGALKCNPAKEGGELPFVQLKTHHNRLHIYCPGHSFTLGEKRKLMYPNQVLPYLWLLPLPWTTELTKQDDEFRVQWERGPPFPREAPLACDAPL